MKLFFDSLKNYLRKVDWFLVILSVFISVCGLILIYSATRSYNTEKFMIVQTASLILGIFILFIVGSFNFEQLSRFWIPVFILNLIFLLSVRFLGTDGGTGNNSWIRFGGIGIQPGEVGKLIFIFTFAKHITLVSEKINSPSSVFALLAHGGIVIGFVYLFSHDLGMAITYILIMAFMLFSSGMGMRWIIPGAVAGGAALPFIYKYLLAPYQQLRIKVVWDPSASEKYSYQAKQSRLAIGAGGLTGSGFLQGRQTQYSLLPAKHTDFIFSVCAEEFGFIGCIVLISLLSLLVFKIFYNASRLHDPMASLMCVGIGSMYLVQTLINIGMCTGLAPVIGLTLPFLSYGGTSLVTNFCAIGIVIALVAHNKPRRIL